MLTQLAEGEEELGSAGGVRDLQYVTALCICFVEFLHIKSGRECRWVWAFNDLFYIKWTAFI